MENQTNNMDSAVASPVTQSVPEAAAPSQSVTPEYTSPRGGSKRALIILAFGVIVVFGAVYYGMKMVNSMSSNGTTSEQVSGEKTMDNRPVEVSNNGSKKDVNIDPVTDEYINTEKKFRIKVPSGWSVDESGTYNTYVLMTSNDTPNGTKDFMYGSVNVVSEKNQGATLDEYMESAKDLLKKYFTNYKLLKQTKVTVNGVPGIIIEGSFDQGQLKFRNNQLALYRNDEVYIITGTAFDATWDKYKDTLLGSLMSFKFDK